MTMKKRIAYISEHASPLAVLGGVDAGGQNVYVAELAKYLSRQDYEVDVFTRWEDHSIPQVVNWKNGVRVVHVKAGPVKTIPKEELLQYMPAFRDNMIRFIEQEDVNYGLVHANFFMSAWVAMELKEILRIPYVVTYHALGHVRKLYQQEQDRFPAERLDIERQTAERADRIIAECPQDKEDLCHFCKADESRITIVPCGFCPSEFYPVNSSYARSYLGLNEDERIILQLGRMVPRKGIDTVIQSLKFLSSSPVRLLVVGGETDVPDPEHCAELRRLQNIAAQDGVLDRVTFTGRKDRRLLKYFYSAADVFVTTPWYEPFGITPLEAMACGTPVIGSNVGGIKYSVKDNETGYLVPAKDPEALAGKIDLLLSDYNLAKKMQVNAIHRVQQLFSWEKIAASMSVVYENVLNETQYKGKGKRAVLYSMHSPQHSMKRIK